MSTAPRQLEKPRAEVWDPSAEDPMYPSDDGKPMADHTEQYDWIVAIKLGLDNLYRDRPDVFVAGNLLWYAVEGEPKVRVAPDAMVAFGRPKGPRSCYKQWQEGGIAPQVVFEVRSPGNRGPEMRRKLRFYELHGAEEYYEYDPFRGVLKGWIREGEFLVPIDNMVGWVSPLLGITFGLEGKNLVLTDPDGRPFLPAVDVYRERDEANAAAALDRRRAERMAEKLRALGFDPDA